MALLSPTARRTVFIDTLLQTLVASSALASHQGRQRMTVTRVRRPTGSVAEVAPFEATVNTDGASGVVTFHGEADLFTLPASFDALVRVIAEHDGPVIVDLADTTFIDVGTVRAIGPSIAVPQLSREIADGSGTVTYGNPLAGLPRLSHLIEPQRAAAA